MRERREREREGRRQRASGNDDLHLRHGEVEVLEDPLAEEEHGKANVHAHVDHLGQRHVEVGHRVVGERELQIRILGLIQLPHLRASERARERERE